MSTPPPPDRPTEPLGRARAAPVVQEHVVAPGPVVQERVVGPAPVIEERVVAQAVDPNVILLRLEDAIDALRTWVVIVGLVAVAALAVAIWAVTHDDTSGRGGSRSGLASDERVSQIETRVDRLSRQVQDLRASGASGSDPAALGGRIDNLESQIKSLSGQSSASGGTQQAVDELSSRIDDLASQVEQLKKSQTTTP
jgi:outer membrane murein-binding lipoprotein Lpp